MSKRRGIVVSEEAQLKSIVAKGGTWDDAAAVISSDHDLAYVKEFIFEPMVKAAKDAEMTKLLGEEKKKKS